MNNKALENFLEKIDKEDFKETKGFKPKDSIADKANRGQENFESLFSILYLRKDFFDLFQGKLLIILELNITSSTFSFFLILGIFHIG